MMKAVLFGTFICFAAACHFQPKQSGCSKVRAGEFYLLSRKIGQEYRIVRNDVNQVETTLSTGTVSTFKIKWNNPCEYVLILVSRKTMGSDTALPPPPFNYLTTQITEVGDDYYIFETKPDNINFIYSDTMRIIKTR